MLQPQPHEGSVDAVTVSCIYSFLPRCQLNINGVPASGACAATSKSRRVREWRHQKINCVHTTPIYRRAAQECDISTVADITSPQPACRQRIYGGCSRTVHDVIVDYDDWRLIKAQPCPRFSSLPELKSRLMRETNISSPVGTQHLLGASPTLAPRLQSKSKNQMTDQYRALVNLTVAML